MRKIAILLLALAGALSLQARSEDQGERAMAGLLVTVARLDNDDFDEREAAQAELEGLPIVYAKILWRMRDGYKGFPEIRWRLAEAVRRIVRHRLLETSEKYRLYTGDPKFQMNPIWDYSPEDAEKGHGQNEEYSTGDVLRAIEVQGSYEDGLNNGDMIVAIDGKGIAGKTKQQLDKDADIAPAVHEFYLANSTQVYTVVRTGEDGKTQTIDVKVHIGQKSLEQIASAVDQRSQWVTHVMRDMDRSAWEAFLKDIEASAK